MKELSSQYYATAARVYDWVNRHRLPLERQTVLFVVASTLDVLLTRYLITHSSSESHFSFVESNPIARYFLDSWGVEGLAWFKFSLVGLVTVIGQIIARRKIDVARRLLYFASLMVLGVVGYSALLIVQHNLL